jgi:hypothetical protein
MIVAAIALDGQARVNVSRGNWSDGAYFRAPPSRQARVSPRTVDSSRSLPTAM